MRAYLPISQSDLAKFLADQSYSAVQVFAPTSGFVNENLDCDEEEIEYLLSILAGESALDLRVSQNSPGIVLAIEVAEGQWSESLDDSILLSAPITWSQVQCALLAHEDDDELVWFATQEIAQELDSWK
jgi:hypothetical protein